MRTLNSPLFFTMKIELKRKRQSGRTYDYFEDTIISDYPLFLSKRTYHGWNESCDKYNAKRRALIEDFFGMGSQSGTSLVTDDPKKDANGNYTYIFTYTVYID
jgi:hypothetical protein